MEQELTVRWIDGECEPQCPPNPAYPNGIDIDLAEGAPACQTLLPYPALRCGAYLITCPRCGARYAVTTAGRADDPASVTIPCKEVGNA